jgi:flagellar hook protein FlgE
MHRRQKDVAEGHGVGALTTVTVDSDGKLKLSYSNEESELLGAIAVADFRDQQKRERIGQEIVRSQGRSGNAAARKRR